MTASPLDRTQRNVEISGLAVDSRKVDAGYLFAAIPGTRADGRQFIPDALRRGAAAVLGPPGLRLDSEHRDVALVTDENPRRRIALMAARFYVRQPETIAAITGTNGKTSVAAFARQIWQSLGWPSASLGTLGIVSPVLNRSAALTTPDPIELHRDLAALAVAGVNHLALEASSHGLEQHRLDGLRVRIAAFTNLSRDHLDYHADMDAYRAAKLRLFDTLAPADGIAVLNADSPEWPALSAVCRMRGMTVIGYGRAAAADDIRLDDLTPLPDGLQLALTVRGQGYAPRIPLAGTFQAMNALCALSIALASGADADAACAALERLQGAPGRMELVARHPNGAAVFVDYAHTPDALETVLSAVRPHVRGRLHVVFGCGGDRDTGKRPMMGQIAAERADRIIVTDDNPRSEDAAAIRGEILAACPGAEEVGDRKRAIFAAIEALDSDDVLVVAGKGHEQGQIVGDRVLPFIDADVAREGVARLTDGK